MESSNILKRICYYMNPKNIEPKMVKLWAFWIIFWIALLIVPKSMVDGTILILVPMAGLFVYALVTKDVMQSLILGTFSCYIMWYKFGCFNGFIDDLYTVLADEENIEMYMSFFLCGGLIIAMKRTGATKAFTEFVTSKAKGNSKIIMALAGIYAGATSVDDYVSALTAGAAFSPLVDAQKKPRLGLAYIVRTISICASAMLPFGAWGYFIIYQIADAKNIHTKAQATSIFMESIPFMFYAIVAIIMALLFAFEIIPKIGPMKKAYELMETKGIQMGDIEGTDEAKDAEEEVDFDEDNPRTKHVSILNLILPLVCIIIALLATGLNCFMAFAIAIVFTGILYVMQGLQTISEYVQCIVDGFIDMVDMVIILMLGYAMQECLYAMGMEDFVSSVCHAVPIASLLPVLFFVFFSCSEYLFSLNYTLYQIAFPVMMVVLPTVGANIPLCVGAIVSAGLFGANACVVSDLGVVSARACRVTIYDQYRTSQPYVIIAGVISAVLYLIAGFVF